MADPTQVTVIMPVKHPHAGYLDLAVGSIVRQSSPRWRLLAVVEQNEQERCRELLGPYVDDERIRIVVNTGRRLAGAVNTGMRLATTPFVALLLADDLWQVSAVATLEQVIEQHPAVDFFHSGRLIIDDRGRPISSIHRPKQALEPADFADGPIKHLLCWRREKGLEVGGLDERSRSVGPDDFDFPWTMADHGARFHPVDACLYLYRDHRSGSRLTTDLPRSVHVAELRRIYRKHGLDRRRTRDAIRHARETYLRQCLYASRSQRLLHRLLRRPAPEPWRETYS